MKPPAIAPVENYSGIPDAAFIRRHVRVEDVAERLGLEMFRDKIRCWHPERHAHGDRTPSVRINRRVNKVLCFGCGSERGSMSPIDLVCDVKECKPKHAIDWIAARFTVPRLAIVSSAFGDAASDFLLNCELPIELIVRSGIWASLSCAARSVCAPLLAISDSRPDGTQSIQISYAGIRRYSGLGSDQSVSNALRDLEALGLLVRLPARQRGPKGPIKEAGSYLLTPQSPEFQEAAWRCSEALTLDAACEKAQREEARLKRAYQLQQDQESFKAG